MQNPLILASGFLGVSKEMLKRVAENGAGAVTIKSISLQPRLGHHNPTVLALDDINALINAVGYSNPGLKEAEKEFAVLSDVPSPVIGSIVGENAQEFAALAQAFNKLPFAAIELPLSCPHTPGFGLLAGHGTVEATAEITSAVKKVTKKPVIVKISPSIQNLGEIAKAAEKAGADALNMGNTLGPGMVIDVNAMKPVLDFKVGGLSGAAIKPVTVRCVYDVFKAVKIPIIGLGGVTTANDAVELILAGAAAVGLGSAVYFKGLKVFNEINQGLEKWMERHGFKSIEEFRGLAHE